MSPTKAIAHELTSHQPHLFRSVLMAEDDAEKRSNAEVFRFFQTAIRQPPPSPRILNNLNSLKRDTLSSQCRDKRDDRGARLVKTSHGSQTLLCAGNR